MFLVNHLIGFGAVPGQILVPGAIGTLIGGMTAGGGLAAAFDGTNSKPQAGSAQSTGAPSGYIANSSVGKDWGAPSSKIITAFEAYSATDLGFLGSGAAIGYKLQGSTDNFSASTVDLASGTTPSGTNQNVIVTSGIIVTTAYRYHRFVLNGNGVNGVVISQVVLYETI